MPLHDPPKAVSLGVRELPDREGDQAGFTTKHGEDPCGGRPGMETGQLGSTSMGNPRVTLAETLWSPIYGFFMG